MEMLKLGREKALLPMPMRPLGALAVDATQIIARKTRAAAAVHLEAMAATVTQGLRVAGLGMAAWILRILAKAAVRAAAAAGGAATEVREEAGAELSNC